MQLVAYQRVLPRGHPQAPPGFRRKYTESRAVFTARGLLVTLVVAAAPFWPVRLAAAPPGAEHEATVAQLPRVRTDDPQLVELMRQGYAQSPTFKDLVDTIERSNLIVYIERHNRFHDHEAGCLRLAGEAGGHRYLRISLSTFLNERELVVFMAHEFMHAVEVAAADEVVDERGLRDLYCRIGTLRPQGFDTKAARDVTEIVSEELARAPDRQ